jgi:hypothetical protein
MSNLKVNTIEAQSGSSIVSNSTIKCNVPPANPNDLTNKQYVDSILTASGIGVNALYVNTQDQYYANLAQTNYVDKVNAVSETITGTKTFTLAPKCSQLPGTLDSLTNRTYVDTADNATLASAQAYTNSQISTINIATTGMFLKVGVPGAVTGASASYTDPVAPNLTAKFTPFLYGADNGYFIIEGKNGASVTGSNSTESFNKIIGTGVTAVTEVVNRVIIDANSLGSSNQVWTNMLASRANSTNYTNTTGRPIQVMVKPNSSTSVAISVGPNTSSLVQIYSNASSVEPPSFVVPISGVYNITFGSFPTSPNGSWMELR